MNPFTAKKLGEVLAFARVAVLTLDLGGAALDKALGAGAADAIRTENTIHGDSILGIAAPFNVQGAMRAKSETTAAKLTAMRDLYIKDEWDNPAEVMEWLGFFEGAAIVHWNLVRGSADALQHEELGALSDRALAYHNAIFKKISEAIRAYAKSKSVPG